MRWNSAYSTFQSVLLVYLSPFSHELSAPFWKSTLYDIEIVKLHDSKIFTILDMDVPWWMLTIDQEHPDHNLPNVRSVETVLRMAVEGSMSVVDR